MNSGYLQKLIKSKDFFNSVLNRIEEIKNLQGQVYLSHLSGSSKSFFIKDLFENHKQILILLPDVKSVSELHVELCILDLSENLISIENFSPDQLQQKLTELLNKKSKIVLSTYDLFRQNFPNPNSLQSSITKIISGDEVGYDNLIGYLNQLNYQKEKFVEAQGDYSQRGSLIDFWSYSEPNPVRLEFDGDLLESIRLFDSESQRSFEKTESVTLAAAINSESEQESSSNIFDYLENPVVLASSFELENLNNIKTEIQSKTKTVSPKIVLEEDDEEIPEEINSVGETRRVAPTQLNELYSQQAVWLIEDELSSQKDLINLGLKKAPSINSNFDILFSVLKNYADQNFDVILTSENELQTNRLRDLLSDFKEELSEAIQKQTPKEITKS